MLQAVADDLWAVVHDVTLALGIHFDARMTVIRLHDGKLVLHSPVPIDDAMAAEIDAIGPVGAIVAPSLFHHLYAGDAKARYPNARLFAVPGLAAKRGDLDIDETLGAEPPAEWADDLEQVSIDGADRLNEVVFFHGASRTLIVSDLVFNIHTTTGWLTPSVLRLVGAYRRLAQSRLWRFATRDRAAASRSIARVLEWDIDRVIMGHGEIVDDDAKRRLVEALRWIAS